MVSKNQVLINDTLNGGKITACKHANGRDWWIMVHRANTNKYYKLLVTPFFIFGPYTQNIGTVRMWDAGHAKFSPDGSKYAYYHYQSGGLDICDFNRCTGWLSNWQNDASVPWVTGNVGLAFSPNSKVLYVGDILYVFQYDLTAANVISSRTMVAAWDSFNQPGQPNLGAYLCYPELAPDGKIYITTGNGTTYFGRIDNPDVVGMGCNVMQHSVLLPTYNFNTIPNHPNYFLDCDSTLGCLCAPTTGLASGHEEIPSVKAFPNPTDGAFTLQFPVQSTAGMLEVYDVMGKLVYKDYIAPWSQYKRVDLTPSLSKREGVKANGMYFCKLKWKDKEASVKVVVER